MDTSLLDRFESQQIPHDQWTHEAHVRVALAYVQSHPEQAMERLRDGIKKLNAVHGVEETPTRGYHETITRVWLELVRQGWGQLGAWEPMWQLLQDKYLLLRFYSRERLMSPEARQGWLEPDVAPIQWPQKVD
jgi:hypothetical protein